MPADKAMAPFPDSTADTVHEIVVASIHRLIAKRLADKQAGLAVPQRRRRGRPRNETTAGSP
jgi:hypothetical protein